jgi:FG-GAP repeat protein
MKCHRALVLVLASTASVTASTVVHVQQAKLVADGPRLDSGFGTDVSLSADAAVVGAPQEPTAAGSGAGAAYVYARSAGWPQQQRLTPSDAGAGALFGIQVSIDGGTIAVGALGNGGPPSGRPGAVYVFERAGTTWAQQQKLTATVPEIGDFFGGAVELSGDTLVVGSPLATVASGRHGAAYVFVRSGTTWVLQQQLDAPTGSHTFGSGIGLSGDTMVVAASQEDTPAGENSGAAYVFVRSGGAWTQQQRLIPSDGQANDWFGSEIEVLGDTIAVGVSRHRHDPPPARQGGVYIFVRSGTTWSEQPELRPPGGSRSFGSAVGLSGDTLLVGAEMEASPSAIVGEGAAYVYTRAGTTWSMAQRLVASDPVDGGLFGSAAAVYGDTVLVGARAWAAAYVFGPAPPATRYFTLAPCRALDTRAVPPALGANTTRTVAVGGVCGVPADATAVAAILTVVAPGDLGNLRVYPTGQPTPLASAINFAPQVTRANNGVLLLGTGGRVEVRCDMPPGSAASTHFVLDVFGYFR